MTRRGIAVWNAVGLSLFLGLPAQRVRAEDPMSTRTVESDTTGGTTKTEDGRTWQSNTTGTVTGAQGGEHEFGVERSGSVVHGEDGVNARESTKTWTNEQGKQVTVEKSGTSTRNADGTVSYEGTKTVTGASGQTRSYETTGSSHVTTAEDGTRSREGSHTTTNTESGRSRTVENSTSVTPTEDGKTWTNDHKVENSAGGSHSSHTEGEVTRNGDGTRSTSSHTDREGTTAHGRTWSGSADRAGTHERKGGSVHSQHSVTHSGGGHGGAHRHH